MFMTTRYPGTYSGSRSIRSPTAEASHTYGTVRSRNSTGALTEHHPGYLQRPSLSAFLRADCEGVLQEYMVCHVAFWFLKAAERDDWSSRPGSRADHQGRFMLQVASKVAEWYSNSEPFSRRRHPSEYPPYSKGTEPSSPASSTTEEAATGDATRSCLLTPPMSSLELIESESDVEDE